MLVVFDPPEEPPRVYKREWPASRWRGSMNEILAAAQAAHDEISRLGATGIIESVKLEFANKSEQLYGSLSAWERAASKIDPAEVRTVEFSVDAVDSAVKLRGDPEVGLTVFASGTESFANGLIATLKSRLSGGAEAGEAIAAAVPLPLASRIFYCLAPVSAFAIVLFFYLEFGDIDVGSILVALLAGSGCLALASSISSDVGERNMPPRFVLVREGDQFPADDAGARSGPVWRSRAWFDQHPLLKLLGTLLAGGLVGALISVAISGLGH